MVSPIFASRANPKKRYEYVSNVSTKVTLLRHESGFRFRASDADVEFTLPDSGADSNVLWATYEIDYGLNGSHIFPQNADRIYFRGHPYLDVEIVAIGDCVRLLCTASGVWEIVDFTGNPLLDGDEILTALREELLGGFAIFTDIRPSNCAAGNGGPGSGMGQAASWAARMLTNTRHNGILNFVELQRFEITGVNQGTSTFTVAGDQTAHFSAGRYMSVRDSTGNDKEVFGDELPYTIVSATYDTDHTDIVVVEAIASAVADGYIYTGRIILQPGMYLFEVTAEGAEDGTACRVANRSGFTYVGNRAVGAGSWLSDQGSAINADSSDFNSNHCSHLVWVRQTDTAIEYWEVQQYAVSASPSVYDFGFPASTDMEEHYCQVKVTLIGRHQDPS